MFNVHQQCLPPVFIFNVPVKSSKVHMSYLKSNVLMGACYRHASVIPYINLPKIFHKRGARPPPKSASDT